MLTTQTVSGAAMDCSLFAQQMCNMPSFRPMISPTQPSASVSAPLLPAEVT